MSRTFQPGDHPDDYRYLFEGHTHTLTDLEMKVWRKSIVQKKIENTENETHASLMRLKWLDNSPEVDALLQQGVCHFYKATFERILREAPSALNTCPQCGSLCRTSKAKLCP